MKASRGHGAHLVEGEAVGRGRRVKKKHPGHVHVIGGGLHAQQHGIEPAQTLHRITPLVGRRDRPAIRVARSALVAPGARPTPSDWECSAPSARPALAGSLQRPL